MTHPTGRTHAAPLAVYDDDGNNEMDADGSWSPGRR